MTIQTRMRRLPLSATLSALLVASPFAAAFAQDAPLARTAGDAALKWGGCPDFMPKGCEIAVVQGDPAKNNTDVFFKVPANAVIPRHWHTSAERMVLVAGELHVTYDGHAAAVLTPGTYAYGPPGMPHKAACGEAGPCVLFIAFNSPVDAFASEDARK
ncbi:MAG: cupin domain-containing protein [Gammaproteobacteria bacterium]|nr:cupin domain-containing protein [Gammaproteobacteria bacterium]